MIDFSNIYRTQSVLILNSPNVITDNNFYVEMCRIPEVLNRLRQYREVLNSHDINIPIWVYCLTQDVESLRGSPQPMVLNLLINLGLFDRWTGKKGWPRYIIGTDPLLSIIAGESSFEEQALLLTNGYCQESKDIQLYQASSYYNQQTGSFCLTSLKRKYQAHSLEKILSYLQNSLKEDESLSDWIFQLLSPHKEDLSRQLKAKGLFPRDFLEGDSSLKWLWPVWKKTQMHYLRKKMARVN